MPLTYRLIGLASLAANATVVATREVAPPVEPVAAAAVPVAARPTATPRAADGLFHLTGRTAAGTARFVVDTGASVTVLTADDATRLGARPLDHDAGELMTAGGRAPIVWHRLPAFSIDGRRIAPLDVAVVRGGIGRSLLGQDVLAQLGTIVIAGDHLELR